MYLYIQSEERLSGFQGQIIIGNVAKGETWIRVNKRNRIEQTYWRQNFVSLNVGHPLHLQKYTTQKEVAVSHPIWRKPTTIFSQFWMEIIVMIDCFLGTPSNWNLKMWSSRPTPHPQKPINHKPPASGLWQNTLQSTSLKNPAEFLLRTKVFSRIRGPGRCCHSSTRIEFQQWRRNGRTCIPKQQLVCRVFEGFLKGFCKSLHWFMVYKVHGSYMVTFSD